MKKTIIIFTIILLFGCKAKIVTIETHTIDTIKVEKIIKFTPSQLNSLVINTPCDSLGNLKPFNYSFGTDNNKVSLKGKNNTIYLEQNLDSIKQVWVKEQNISVKTSDIVTKVPYIPKWCYYSLLINLLLLVWTFRKFIPILKFIP
jgi:hypothetical protein